MHCLFSHILGSQVLLIKLRGRNCDDISYICIYRDSYYGNAVHNVMWCDVISM